MKCHPRSCQTKHLNYSIQKGISKVDLSTILVSVFYNVIVLFLVLCCEYCILLYMPQMRTLGKIG